MRWKYTFHAHKPLYINYKIQIYLYKIQIYLFLISSQTTNKTYIHIFSDDNRQDASLNTGERAQ